MPRPPALRARALACPVGPHPIRAGWLVGEDAEGRLAPVDRAVRFSGVAGRAHPGARDGEDPRVEVAPSGSFVLAFRGWSPTFADVGRTVWAFSPTEVAGAPLRTPFAVGRVVGLATTESGETGVRVEVEAGFETRHRVVRAKGTRRVRSPLALAAAQEGQGRTPSTRREAGSGTAWT